MPAPFPTFAEFRAARDIANAAVDARAADLQDVKTRLMAAYDVTPGPMGLTPDCVKFHPEFRAAQRAFRIAMARLQAITSANCKHYARDISRDIEARRIAKRDARRRA